MDSNLIGQKLEALRHCISRIVEKCPDNASLLAEDADLQDMSLDSTCVKAHQHSAGAKKGL